MIHFIFTDKEPRYLFLKVDNKTDVTTMNRLKDHLNLTDPVCYLPTYSGPPFTQDFLWDYVKPDGERVWYCSIGLWKVIYDFFNENNIEYDGLKENQHMFKRPIKHSFEEFKAIVDSWGLKFPPRPYQYECAYKILQWKSSISQLATRAGKTMLAYIVFRYAMEHLGMKRILMIVPAVDLVTQGYDDFNDYAEFFKTECVWAGGKLVESANMTIGTFQSLIQFLDKTSKKYNPSFFDGYDCVFVDETHRAKASQIKTIISQPFMKDVKIKFGMTGTLPKPKTIDFYCIHSLLGAKIQTIKPKELMDEGYISNVHINQVYLKYPNNDYMKQLFINCAEYSLGEFVTEPNKKNPRKRDKVKLANPKFLVQYLKEKPPGLLMAKNQLIKMHGENTPEFYDKYIGVLKTMIKSAPGTNGLVIEKMMTHFCKERVDYLCKEIIPKCTNNMLILAHHTEYINYITEIIKERFPDRHIDTITGAVKSKRRNEIKQMLKDNKDCILIASYGCIGTGITLSDLCYGVLFESFKSEVINMQSIGRGLGLSDMKDRYILYDIIDEFDKAYSSKKIYLQGKEKIKIYKETMYEYEVNNVKL